MGTDRAAWRTHHHVVPLVEPERQVSVRLDPARVRRVHDRLAGGTDGDRLSQLRVARLGNPRHLPAARYSASDRVLVTQGRQVIRGAIIHVIQGGVIHITQGAEPLPVSARHDYRTLFGTLRPKDH